MRLTDLIRSAVGGLWQQKVRTALTLTGVAVGASSLAFSLSLGVGLRGMVDREFKSRPGFWEIDVHPGRAGRAAADPPPEKVAVAGDLSADRKARIREQLVGRYQALEGPGDPAPLTPDAVAAARIDGEWLILDNRHMLLLTDSQTSNVTPLATLDLKDGVRHVEAARES